MGVHEFRVTNDYQTNRGADAGTIKLDDEDAKDKCCLYIKGMCISGRKGGPCDLKVGKCRNGVPLIRLSSVEGDANFTPTDST